MQQYRDSSGRFTKGHTFAKGRPKGSQNQLQKELQERMEQRSDDGQNIDTLLMDIAFDTSIEINTRVKAASKIADLVYGSKSNIVIEDESEQLSCEELEQKLRETIARFNGGV